MPFDLNPWWLAAVAGAIVFGICAALLVKGGAQGSKASSSPPFGGGPNR